MSVAPFTVTPGTATVNHDRSVVLKLRRHSASGRLSADDGFAACRSGMTVKIQRRGNHGWRTVGAVKTKATGKFSKHIGRRGTYRAVAPRVVLGGGTDSCGRSVSRPHRI